MTVTMTEPRCRADSLELGALDGSVPSARLHTRAVLREWGLDLLLDDSESVTAELVANAIQATRDAGLGTGVRLTLTSDGAGVRVIVWDAVALPPVSTNPDADCEHGRGLLIVQALAAEVDCLPIPAARGGGKLVRAYLAMPSTSTRSA
jgi:anti-sigma regulatory factor (Ser/Thr protein kinase)